jgi:hypothetical protein
MGDKVLKTKFDNKGCHPPTLFVLLSIVIRIKEGSARAESVSSKKMFLEGKTNPSGFVFFVLAPWLILRGQSV